MDSITNQLKALADHEYRAFQSKLIPTIDPKTILGVRVPDLRRLAKQWNGTPQAQVFMNTLPHDFHEEMNLHGYLIEYGTDYETTISQLNCWLPYVNNWATCDTVAPKVLGRHLPQLEQQITQWLAQGETYTVRYAVGMLQRHFLGQAFQPRYLEWVAAVSTEEYYLHMMVAWFFATALYKQPEAALAYLQNNRLDKATHNKAIQKAVESHCISSDMKDRLRLLRRR